MQPSAKTTGIEAILKAGMSLLSVFHGRMDHKLLEIIDLQDKVMLISFGNSRNNVPQLIDYKHSAGLLSGHFSLRNIFAVIGG